MLYPTFEEAIQAHAKAFGCSPVHSLTLLPPPRDDALASALARPQHYAHYGGADFPTQVAVLLHGIVQAHAFLDGNKRTATALTAWFVELNGYRLILDPIDLAGLAIAASTGADLEGLIDFLREVIEPAESTE